MAEVRMILVSKELLDQIIFHLTWMMDQFEFQREQTNMDVGESPEIKDIKRIKEELRDLVDGYSAGANHTN